MTSGMPDSMVSLRRGAGLLAMAVGLAALAAWRLDLTEVLGVLPASPPIPVDAALGVILAGLALVVRSDAGGFAVRGRQVCAAAVLVLGLVQLGWAMGGPGILPTTFIWEGLLGPLPADSQRLALTTSLALVAGAVALWPLPSDAGARRRTVAAAMALVPLAIGATALAIHALVGTHLLVSTERGITSVLGAVALVAIGIGLADVHRRPRGERTVTHVSEDRIVNVGTWAMILVALVAGLPGFLMLAHRNETALNALLTTVLRDRSDRLAANVAQRASRARGVAQHPALVALSGAGIGRDVVPAQAVEALESAVRPLGPGAFHSIAVVDGNGRHVAAIGNSGAQSTVLLPLDGADGASLAWDGALILRTRHGIAGTGLTLVADQSLPQMAQALKRLDVLGPGAVLSLCDVGRPDPLCVPVRETAVPPSSPSPQLVAMMRRSVGGRIELGMLGEAPLPFTMAACSLLPGERLALAVIVDAGEYYGPIARTFHAVLLMLVAAIGAGHALLRWRVRPLVKLLQDVSEYVHVQAMAASDGAAMHHSVFVEAPNAILLIDGHHRVVDANERASAVFGRPHAELCGMSVDQLVNGEARGVPVEVESEPQRSPIEPTMAPHGAFQACRSDGTAFPVDVLWNPIVGIQGDLTVVTVQDITERVAAEEALRASEQRFRRMMEHAPIGMALVAPDGRFLEVNSAFCDMLGYDRDTILRRDFQALTHPDDLAEDTANATLLLSGARSTYRMQKRYFHCDGHEVWADLSVSLVRDRDGHPIHFISQIQDITEDRRNRESREALTAFLDALLDAEGINLVVCGPDGRIRQFSRGAAATFGWSGAEIVGRVTPLVFHDPAEVKEMARARDIEVDVVDSADTTLFGRLLEAGWNERQGWTFVARDGRRFPGWLTASRVQDRAGKQLGALAIITDVSDLRQRDRRIEQALREKEILLKEVYHRVKNNLQVVSSLLWLQARESQETAARAVLTDSMLRVRAMALVHEKLYQSEHLDEIPLDDYVTDLCRHLAETGDTGGRGVTIDTRCEPASVGLETAVPLGLLLNELITNSLKHAFPDSRRGSISVTLTIAADERAVIAITDDGVGFPSAFDPWKTDSLGLKLVRNLAAQLDGEIDFSGAAGTSATVRFPISRKQQREALLHRTTS